MKHYMKQFLVTTLDRTLPIYIELTGYNEWQEEFDRPEGYHCYHWLHTVSGEGQFECSGTTVTLDRTRESCFLRMSRIVMSPYHTRGPPGTLPSMVI